MGKGMGVGWFVVGNPAVNVVLVVLGVQNVQKMEVDCSCLKSDLVSNKSILPLNYHPFLPPTIHSPTSSISSHYSTPISLPIPFQNKHFN